MYKNAETRKKWFEEMRMVLLKEGYTGGTVEDIAEGKNFSKKQRKKVFQLRKYFRKHRSRMKYRERLAEGRSIGSGLVEKLGGKTLKANGSLLESGTGETELPSSPPLSTSTNGTIAGCLQNFYTAIVEREA